MEGLLTIGIEMNAEPGTMPETSEVLASLHYVIWALHGGGGFKMVLPFALGLEQGQGHSVGGQNDSG